MEPSAVSWRIVAGRRSRRSIPPSGRRFRAFLSCGSAPPPTWAQSASYIRRSKRIDAVNGGGGTNRHSDPEPTSASSPRCCHSRRDTCSGKVVPALQRLSSLHGAPPGGRTTALPPSRQEQPCLAWCSWPLRSIYLGRVLAYPSLPARAWQTLGLLVSPLLIGFFLLVPGQSRTVLAWELIVSAVLLGAGGVAIDRRSVRSEKDTPLPLVGRLQDL